VAKEDRLLQSSALELRTVVAEESGSVRGYLLSGSDKFLNPFYEGRSEFADKTTSLQNLVQSDEDNRLLSEIDALHSRFLGIAEDQITLRDQGFPQAAVFLWQTEGNEVQNALNDTLSEFVQRQEVIISAHTRDAEDDQNQAMIVSFGLVGIALLVAIIGGIWITRSITKPLASLSQTATKMAGGDLSEEVAVQREDEVGILARAFNSMTSQLRSLVDGLEQKVSDRTRELEKLEQLGRAIVNAPSNVAVLPELLQEYVPAMFPQGKVDILLFHDQMLMHHPHDAPHVAAPAWEYVKTMNKPQHFLPGDVLPWTSKPTSNALVLVPILDEGSKKTLGGISLEVQCDPDNMRSVLPAVQSLSAHISSALHHAATDAEMLAHQKVSQELALAGQIQANFLPSNVPTVPGWGLATILKPARETSGDFYDLIPLSDGRLGILIADVADKGMAAALYMALSCTLIRTYAATYDTQPEVVLSAANHRILSDAAHAGLFVTVFYGILDSVTGTLSYCNAGHNPPYVLRSRQREQPQELLRTGIPLGIFESGTWEQEVVRLLPGDMLLLYTDGITEAENDAGVFFGEERLLTAAQAKLGCSAKDIQEAIIEVLEEFVGDQPQSDDITLMVLTRELVEATSKMKMSSVVDN